MGSGVWDRPICPDVDKTRGRRERHRAFFDCWPGACILRHVSTLVGLSAAIKHAETKSPYRALSSISVEITTTTGGAHQKVPRSPLAAIVTASSAPLKPMSPVARPSRLASSATCAKIWVPANASATSAMTLLSPTAADVPRVPPDASKVPHARSWPGQHARAHHFDRHSRTTCLDPVSVTLGTHPRTPIDIPTTPV